MAFSPFQKDPGQRVRVAKAFVVLELTDGSTAAYAMPAPLEVIQTITPNRESMFDPYGNIHRMLPPFSHDLTFEFREVHEYRMVWLDPDVWGGFKFDAPAIEAGESND